MSYWVRLMLLAVAGGLFLSVPGVLAHGGALDARGGHTDRSTGQYHCHRAPCTTGDQAASAAVGRNEYDRDDWSHWLDEDGDCLNTRHEVLLAQSVGGVVFPPNGCRVVSGLWTGPYTGNIYRDPSDLDIDHVIPLAWAHARGGAGWSRAEKAAFANDPLNLMAVDDGLNQSKGAKGPGEWLPPQSEYVCDYLFRWVSVLAAYPDLIVTHDESMKLEEGMAGC